MMITQIQKAKYGRYQISDVQKNRKTTSPSPLAIAHQPSQRPGLLCALPRQLS